VGKPSRRRTRELLIVAALAAATSLGAQNVTLLNVSHDPTRELSQDFNPACAKYWQAKAGRVVTVQQSHGGSGKQARAEVTPGRYARSTTLARIGVVDVGRD
jgi:ABC-type sulfate transport system substrate-binding protein